MTCRIEFEDLEAWKKWFDTGDEAELVDGLMVIERTVELLTSSPP